MLWMKTGNYSHALGWLFASLLLAILTGCSKENPGPTQEGAKPLDIKITSTAFKEGGNIPRLYTCEDKNITPPLEWTGVPENTESMVIIMDDPDAPAGTWTHWVLYDIEPNLNRFLEAQPESGKAGMNDFGRSAYGGPCPPKGSTHRYYFRLYALDVRFDLKQGASRKEVENLMQGHILAQGELMGKFGR